MASDNNGTQIHQPSLHCPAVLNGTIREAVLSAVPQEMRTKEAHWSNIVVSLVYPANDVINDIIFHFDIHPSIKRTHRIRHETPGWIQLLLVTFADQAAAIYLIDNTKLL